MAPTIRAIGDYCRLCAVEAKNGVIIYSIEGVSLCLEEKITQCLRIEVSKNDLLPKKVCRPCRARLEDYHRFAERANKVQHTLEMLLSDFDMSAGPSEVMVMDDMEMKHISEHNNIESYPESLPVLEGLNEEDISLKNDIADHKDSNMVKDEFLDLPLDVTLESDCNQQFDLDDPSSSEDSLEEPLNDAKQGDDRPVRLTRRRKMLTPKKADRTTSAVAKTRAVRTRRAAPQASSSEEVDEELEDELNDDDDPELTELTLFKGIHDVVVEGEEGEVEGEPDQKAKEEWKTHWGIKCLECEQIYPFKSTFDRHYRQEHDKKPSYTCSYCNKTMEKYSTFRSHCYRHVTEGRYRCEYCQKGFSLRSMLHVHILAKHTTVKPFICEECGKGFVTRPGLNIHLKKHKAEVKSEYPCLDCGKILHTRGGLTAHQNVHKLGRRFMCDVCGKTFTQKVNMLQHVKHHTGERPYACEKCGKCFAEKSHLNRHYSFHSEKRPFQCKVCFKMYKTERCLKVHAMVHSDARPYVCTYCNKGFLSTTKLKQHNNIHTGERPYACKFCERTFTNYPNWLKHTRRRHKTDPRSGMHVRPGNMFAGNHHLDDHSQEQHLLPELSEDRGSNHPVALVTSVNTDSGAMSMMAPYPHQTHHQSLAQLDQRMQDYPEHLITMTMHNMPHHHHVLPM